MVFAPYLLTDTNVATDKLDMILKHWEEGRLTFYSQDSADISRMGWLVDSGLRSATPTAGLPGFMTYIETDGSGSGDLVDRIRSVFGNVLGFKFKGGPLYLGGGDPLIMSLNKDSRGNLRADQYISFSKKDMTLKKSYMYFH